MVDSGVTTLAGITSEWLGNLPSAGIGRASVWGGVGANERPRGIGGSLCSPLVCLHPM